MKMTKTNQNTKRFKVAVAMSGGVDSSVAAALLVEQGYDVIGVTMKVFCYGDESIELTDKSCCSLDSIEDARSVCRGLGIQHLVLNFEKEFKETVMDNFVFEYLSGRTPIPCVNCNSFLKFPKFYDKVRIMDVDYIATGHYARVIERKLNGTDKSVFKLLKGLDDKKDQSYFLWGLSQMVLSRTLFPIGEMTKSEVREKAKELGLRTANKTESQEICFIPDNNYRRFLQDRIDKGFVPEELKNNGFKPGDMIDTEGNVLASHAGIANYTVGQRKGLGLAVGEPVYVTEIRNGDNVIVVGTQDKLYSSELTASSVNWVSSELRAEPIRADVKIRYLHDAAPATVIAQDRHTVSIQFDKPQRAITAGQSTVFYNGDEMIGGGVID